MQSIYDVIFLQLTCRNMFTNSTKYVATGWHTNSWHMEISYKKKYIGCLSTTNFIYIAQLLCKLFLSACARCGHHFFEQPLEADDMFVITWKHKSSLVLCKLSKHSCHLQFSEWFMWEHLLQESPQKEVARIQVRAVSTIVPIWIADWHDARAKNSVQM